MSDWTLIFVGPCNEFFKNEWAIKLKNANADKNIKWISAQPPNSLIKLYNNSKVVICSSRKEGAPIIFSEAVLSGCAFISTKVGEMNNILNGLPGLVEDEIDLANMILKFSQDNELIQNQANALYGLLKDRDWSMQFQKITI